jgi:hypothetical protein
MNLTSNRTPASVPISAKRFRQLIVVTPLNAVAVVRCRCGAGIEALFVEGFVEVELVVEEEEAVVELNVVAEFAIIVAVVAEIGEEEPTPCFDALSGILVEFDLTASRDRAVELASSCGFVGEGFSELTVGDPVVEFARDLVVVVAAVVVAAPSASFFCSSEASAIAGFPNLSVMYILKSLRKTRNRSRLEIIVPISFIPSTKSTM